MKKDRGTYDTTKVSKELKNWLQLKELLSSDDLDEQTLFDTIDGETQLVEVLIAVKESALEDKCAIKGLDSYIDDLNLRKQRIKKSMDTKDSIILSAMERANIPTIKSPVLTMSKKHTTKSVVILDESQIPAKYFKSAAPSLSKKDLKDALNSGETVPGASLSNGGITLSTRII